MVRSGQRDLEDRRYRNPTHPRSGLELLTLAELRRRLPERAFGAAHRVDFHQIMLISTGSGVATVDFMDCPCGPGTLLHVRPGQVQRLPVAHSRSDELEGSVVLFTSSFTRDVERLVGGGDSPLNPITWTLSETDYLRFSRALADLTSEYAATDGDELSNELLRHLVNALLIRMALLPGPHLDDPLMKGSPTFHRFQSELERSFTTTRQARAYAARLGCSVKTLTRVCQGARGQTAKALIDARVTLEARRLLVHTDLTIDAIGRQLGFTEATNFGKFFTRETGGNPGAFRASQAGDDSRPLRFAAVAQRKSTPHGRDAFADGDAARARPQLADTASACCPGDQITGG